ncbi:tyrosine-type recombinase/integrase [Microbispora sp. RL4-1S]|uniref:Tyrosine-type recombinase/integrase n=1 Tax=Microbispora oryzae TaxID=2806554 RepID=A0A940WRV5_9ACTN|nr:tyrosine-type recombinase/integrase [Microbispora oryzae]MBP2708213.1 tyrosine-type recombinase/integrase [Microbispora oryzae]
MSNTTFNVRVYKIEKRKNAKGTVTSYRVLWQTAGLMWKRPFPKEAQADAFRSKLVTAARSGEPFSLATGEPASWARADRPDMSWYSFACKFVDMKWTDASAKHRAGIAYALTMATFGMLDSAACPYDSKEVRTALRRWGFNTKERPNCPERPREILEWVERNSLQVSALSAAATARALLNAATIRLDGKRVAASSNRRHRVILSNALAYAVEVGLLDKNPIPDLKWTVTKTTFQVDRRSVVNPDQARALLAAVASQKPSGALLMPFFAVLYFTGLRPEEAVNLREKDLTLPDAADTWGELYLTGATPEVGKEWTDTGEQRDTRGLKHRAEGETRSVPCPPELVTILRRHLKDHGTGPGGRVFHGAHGGVLAKSTVLRIWRKARKKALTPEEYASPLARRPYDLRHACLSTWLNAGVSPKQVSEWAGNSVEVLHRTYEKCLVGHDEIAMRRISEVLRPSSPEDIERD